MIYRERDERYIYRGEREREKEKKRAREKTDTDPQNGFR